MSTTVSLGANKYGKAENRVVRITRDTARHEIEDLNVTSQLRGAKLIDSYLVGDNSLVVATDTQKNTIYAFAKEYGIGSPEEFLLRLGDHFVSSFDWIEGACGRPSSTPGSASRSTAPNTTIRSSARARPPGWPPCRRSTARPTSPPASRTWWY